MHTDSKVIIQGLSLPILWNVSTSAIKCGDGTCLMCKVQWPIVTSLILFIFFGFHAAIAVEGKFDGYRLLHFAFSLLDK